jgi:mRNA-degrading endonuclease RelE of RelBE toxin-antitoxin system
MGIVVLSPAAAKQLNQLPGRIHGRLLKLLERLEGWPNVSGVKALSGNLAGHFRLRTGDYRIQFVLWNGRVFVEKIGHRDGFYLE